MVRSAWAARSLSAAGVVESDSRACGEHQCVDDVVQKLRKEEVWVAGNGVGIGELWG